MSEKKQTNKSDKNNKKTKKVSVFRVILVSFIIIGFIGAGAVAGMVLSVIKSAEPIDASNVYELLDESSFVLDSEGEVIEKIESNKFRVIVDYSKMPEHLKNAFVAIEDERFWKHKGIDIKRIFGAAWTNLRTGSRQGASTINQQLAINLYLSRNDGSIQRKIKDAYYGILLNRQLTKEQILEAYLNTIYLGSGAHGVQAAAQVYFSKDVEDLTIAESALIAGITRNPSRNTPIITLKKEDVEEHHIVLDESDSLYTVVMNPNIDKYTLQRQKLVLNSMKRLGYITDQQYEEALAEDIKSHLKPKRLIAEEISSFFGDLVKRDVVKALEKNGYSKEEATDLLYSGGLRIHSTIDKRIQRILDEEYANASNFPQINQNDKKNLINKYGFTVDEQGTLRDEEKIIQPQSAMVISDYHTGEIKAIVGGRLTSGQRILNRALTPRQPGSAIKPIAVYAPALDRGFTAATVIDDVPTYFNKAAPNSPWPKNPYLKAGYRGLITIRESIERSSNVGVVKTASMLGKDERSSINIMLDYIENMGISTVYRSSNPVTINGKKYTDETFSTAMGGMTKGVSPLEMNAAFGIFGNQGTYIEPVTFTEIRDRHGNLILENKPERKKVLTPQTSYVMTDMLKGVISSPRGTGGRASLGKMPAAGKTGTTSDQKDAWFVGYTPYYAGTVWIGSDKPARLTSGSGAAASLWKKIMTRVHEDHAVKDFPMPEDIVRVNVCTISGKLPTDLCSADPRGNMVKSEIFVKGTQPTEPCDVHVTAEIHKPSGKLATDLTPSWEVESGVFVKRPVPYKPEEHGGIAPIDHIYDLPTEYYDPLVDGVGGTPPFTDGSTEMEDEGTEDRNTENEGPNENFIDIINDILNRH